LFEGLARYDEQSMEPVPGSAESWTVSEDGRRYAFTIREDAQWSDGTPVTAHDFSYSWRRLQNAATGGEYAYLFHMVKHAAEFNLYAGQAERLKGEVAEAYRNFVAANSAGANAERWGDFVREHALADLVSGTSNRVLSGALEPGTALASAEALAAVGAALAKESQRRSEVFEWADAHFGVDAGIYAIDDKHLVVELVAPTPYFLSLAAFYPALPVPRWVVEAPGNSRDWFLPEKIVTNGAFHLESWRVNDRIRMVKSPTYWGRDEVRLNRIDALPIEHEATALNLYLTGEVEWLKGLYPLDLSEALSTRDDFYAYPGLAVYFFKINTTRPPLDDARVRRAINMSIDRELIAQEVLQLGQLPAKHYVPPGMPGYESPENLLPFDPEAARRLLADAGFPNGEGMREIGILYNTNESHKKVAEVVADHLRRNLGIEARAYNQEWQSFLTTVKNRDYDISRYGWIGDYEDPNTFLDMWLTGGGNNNTGFADPVFDRWIAAAADVAGYIARTDLMAEPWKEPARVSERLAAVERASSPGERRRALGHLRMQILREAEAILIGDALPIIPVYFYVNSGLLAPEVRGFYMETEKDGVSGVNLRDLHPFRGVWIDEKALHSERGSRL
jgi:oligopeptide transport system substrate-binding protein